jgi:hypothetical protein
MKRTSKCKPDNRGIPENVRFSLRAEVNFGCPVHNCGSPYLTYHHFDPPFHRGETHDSDGMIALCLAHHKIADVGTWTHEQLRLMKLRPFLSGDAVLGHLEWQRRDVLIQAGGNLALNPGVLLEANGRNIIWTERASDGSLHLNVDIVAADGTPLFYLSRNEWLVAGAVDDLRASASAHSLRVCAPMRGVTLEIRFRDLPESTALAECERRAHDVAGKPQVPPDLLSVLPSEILAQATPTFEQALEAEWAPFAASGVTWPALHATVAGRIVAPVQVKLTRTKLEVSGQRRFSRNRFFVAGATLISVASDSGANLLPAST